MPDIAKRRRFLLFIVKPSHYDDEGYVIQWWKSALPSNSLACLFGIAQKCMEEQVLGEDVDIEIFPVDETNTRVRPDRIARQIQDNCGFGMVGFVGVQSNQFPRVMDCARPLRAAGVQVCIGGFHVSGCLSMLPETPDSLKEALDLGISLYAGEAEGRFDEVLRDAAAGNLKPIYNYLHDLPGLEGATGPYMPPERVGRTLGMISSFDAGRGCPFLCSFCTIINVQGRKSRHRTADDIERLVREQSKQGVTRFFITDDNFARNRNWESILDRLIELGQRENIRVKLTMQVDTLCHKIPHFIEKAAAAGCKSVFIGLESINPESLKGASKGQNRITEYRRMLQAWKHVKVLTQAGYILGFTSDTPETIARDIAIIQRELPIDILEFFVLTPLPGSKDHQDLYLRGIWMEPDTNNYDAEHVCMAHPLMSATEWRDIYERAWHLYYSPEHIETLFKRAVAWGTSTGRLAAMVFSYYGSYAFERVHPLQSGLIRRKVRRQRRRGLPCENLIPFSIRRAREMFSTCIPALRFRLKLERIRRRIMNDPASTTYTDLALSPVDDDLESDKLELLQNTEAARRVTQQARLKAAALQRIEERRAV